MTDNGEPSRRPLVAVLAAHGISVAGSAMTYLAVPWFVLETTGSAALTGVAAFAEALSVVLAALLGGAWVDRLGFRRASILADLASAAVVVAIPLFHGVGVLALPLLLALVFTRSFFDTPASTARLSLMPQAAATAAMPLERAHALVQAVERGARLVGAPVAGVLIAVLGASAVLWIDAATFLVSAGVMAGWTVGARSAARDRTSGDIVAGLRFILQDPVLRTIVMTVAITNLLEAPILAVILPIYAREAFSAVELGLMIAAVGGGALFGAIAFGSIGARWPRRGTFIGAFLLVGSAYGALGAVSSLPLTIAALALAGLAAGPINPIIISVAQERVPEALRGRALGAITASAFVSIPLGMLLAGVFVEAFGVRTTLLGIAAGYLVVSASMALNPALRGLRREAAVAPTA